MQCISIEVEDNGVRYSVELLRGNGALSLISALLSILRNV